MFQPWFIELISVLSDIFVGLSALIVAIVAIIGIWQWKTELKGRTKFEIAKRMAMLAFEYRDRYKSARSPFTLTGESAERVVGEEETREETDLLNEYYARQMRLKPLQETLRKLYETSWEAEIVLDDEIGKLIKPLEATYIELFAATEAYFTGRYNLLKHPPAVEASENWFDMYHRKIYSFPEEDISTAIDKATQDLAENLKPYLK